MDAGIVKFAILIVAIFGAIFGAVAWSLSGSAPSRPAAATGTAGPGAAVQSYGDLMRNQQALMREAMDHAREMQTLQRERMEMMEREIRMAEEGPMIEQPGYGGH